MWCLWGILKDWVDRLLSFARLTPVFSSWVACSPGGGGGWTLLLHPTELMTFPGKYNKKERGSLTLLCLRDEDASDT